MTAPPMPTEIEETTLPGLTLPVVDVVIDSENPSVTTEENTTPAATSAAAPATVPETAPVTVQAAPVSPEGVDAEGPIVAPDMPALTDENGNEYRNADYRWLDRGVYEATVNGNHGSEFYVFYDIYSGKIMNVETGTGIPFTCEQTRSYIVFHEGGVEDKRIMYITTDDALNVCGTWEDNDAVTYMFMDVHADPDTFNIDDWKEGRGDIIP